MCFAPKHRRCWVGGCAGWVGVLGVLGVLGGCKTRLEFKNLNQSIPCFYFLIFTGGHVFKVMLVDNVGVFTKETFTISAYSSIGPVKTHVADTSITKGPALYLVSFTGRDPLTTRLIVEAPVGSCVDIQSVSVTPKPVCAVRRLCACVCGTSPVCLCARYVACVPVSQNSSPIAPPFSVLWGSFTSQACFSIQIAYNIGVVVQTDEVVSNTGSSRLGNASTRTS